MNIIHVYIWIVQFVVCNFFYVLIQVYVNDDDVGMNLTSMWLWIVVDWVGVGVGCDWKHQTETVYLIILSPQFHVSPVRFELTRARVWNVSHWCSKDVCSTRDCWHVKPPLLKFNLFYYARFPITPATTAISIGKFNSLDSAPFLSRFLRRRDARNAQ